MKNIGDTSDHKHEKCDRICTNQVSATNAEAQCGRNGQRVFCILGLVPLQVSGSNTN
jgi:hypothetical protein